MTISTGASVKVGYIAETTWGTTPATPQLISIPFTSFNVNLTQDQYKDSSIQADRMERYSISGDHHVTGDFQVNLSPSNFDPFLASAVYGTWATNTLKVGQTLSSFTLEQGHTDISLYTQYTGVMVDKLDLTVPSNGAVTAKFTVIGKDQSAVPGSTSIDGSAYTAAIAGVPFTHIGGTFKEGGTTIGVITSLAMSVANNLTANFACGSTSAQGVTPGFTQITGTLTAYVQDASLLTKFYNGTSSAIDFTLASGAHTLEFSLPNVKYTGATRNISGQGSVMVTMPFTALYDSGSSSLITITRV